MKNIFLTTLLIAALAFGALAPAQAGYEGIVETVTIDSGTSVSTISIPFSGNLKELYVDSPAIDAGDTTTVTLTLSPIDESSEFTDGTTRAVAPNGWTDTLIGATEDDAVVKVLSTSTNIYCWGTLNLTLQTSTDQAADRTFQVLLLREY